ncbi:DUF6493 family protein [Streptomyces sp. NPDC058231]|uniref:DUF7824 domain-containing protein n=1 Tax=Streptomyces sp. NPDC058231 TaxID=3346392 RepID=UPI0036F17259
MKELLTAVLEGRKEDVPALLLRLGRAERRTALTELKVLRKEARSWGWREREKIQKALLIAGAGCHTGAAGCASWLGGRELREWTRSPYPLVLEALADRDPEWLGDLAHRLAGRPTATRIDHPFVAELVKRARCPVPTAEGFVVGWAETVSTTQWRQRRPQPLIDTLRADPHLTTMVPRLFEVVELPPQVIWYGEADARSPDNWPAVLAALTDEGLLDRPALVTSCVSRLLRGGKPGDLRFFLAVLRRLALTEQEEEERVADWAGMAADRTATVAGHAQGVLARLHERGFLTVRRLADVSGPVLFRPEKKLVRAQLVQLGKALRRDATAAEELLPVVAEAFGHEDIGIQEQALKLVARYAPPTGDPLLEELAISAALLGPAHRAAAAEVFGDRLLARSPEEPYEEMLPPVPSPRRLEPAPETIAELVEEVVALVRSGSRELTAFERALDGLVRRAHTDRPALAGALREALAGRWWLDDASPHAERTLGPDAGIELVVAVLLGRVSAQAVHDGRAGWTETSTCVHAALDGVLRARLWEAAWSVLTGRSPFLLATPTWHTGSLDPTVLVERLRDYQRIGAEPGDADFAQALLRVRRGTTCEAARVAEAAGRLGTAQGDRLAAWLGSPGPVVPVRRRRPESDQPSAHDWSRRPAAGSRRVLLATAESPVIQMEFPRSFHWLGRPHFPDGRRCYHWGPEPGTWLATLPEDGEALAAWTLPAVTACATGELRGAAWPLPGLVELGGPAGEAIHLAVAYGLGARHPEDRLSAVDALLFLASQGRLDAELLGRELASLIDRDLVKPNRLAESARTAAATGAYRTVLTVLVAALPPLLAYEGSPRGLGDLLSVAAECTERCGAVRSGPIAGLATTAARGGSSQLVRHAVRLKAAWEQGVR